MKHFVRPGIRLASLLGGVVVLAALVVGGYFWWSETQPVKYTRSLEKVTIGVEKSFLPAAVWVAENKGYFEEERLNLTIKEFDSGKASLIAMLNGEGIDISAAAPTPIMFSSFVREDFFIISTFAYAYEDIKVIANKDSGINNAEDLKGKKIGTLMGSTGQFFTETFLIHNSISPSDVEVVNIAPTDLPEALKNGHIDAQVIWEPHGTTARDLLGDKAIRLPSGKVYKTTFNFLTMKNFANENPEILERFLRGINKATDFLNNNKEESQKIIANRLNLIKEVVALHWDDFTFNLSLDQTFFINIESEARWAIRNELTDKTKVPNYLEYIYIDALESVKPEAVTIIR
ncbi:MAG: transporter substrate-binding domain-containing protein [Candidatus Glassbacteria bacterium]|nr:transporter substrate-binding domain-containing protein [Candidatus Glassbacteria bacterium]